MSRDEGPKAKCFKCKKRNAKGWYRTKPVCAKCFEGIKKPRRIVERELLERRRVGILCL